MIAILVGYGSYSCGRYRKRASGRNDAEMDCRTERKNLSAVGKTDGRGFLFRGLQYAFIHAGCMQRPRQNPNLTVSAARCGCMLPAVRGSLQDRYRPETRRRWWTPPVCSLSEAHASRCNLSLCYKLPPLLRLR